MTQEQCQWAQAEQAYQQAIALKIEFNDRYNQASTYGQLGLLAEAQAQWPQAQQYLLQALQIFVEFQDEYSVGMTIRNLARLYYASGDADLPAAAAKILGASPAEVAELFQQAGDEAGGS